ncbi:MULTISPECIES: head completion/stabilization protein [unclassified Gilliamella]|uniref:head completion/stabilization protein n=1 Tax=unclassified Gilliamella TaxID=2685620 RepID=UPI00226A99BF|nr:MULTISPECIES: head completion/stabilization protein [unclassified Gilliamella]MCX8587288.1 head completion/stabilization protein [Gilliamella sp. B3801]MCX8591957.1 head completion/stabilization protein [Gilliamella sp. B3804]
MFSGQDFKQSDIYIKNDGFWPDLDLSDFMIERSMSPNINQQLIRDALVSAVVEINLTLEQYKKTQISNGVNTASKCGVVSVDGISSTVIIYKKAVFARAKSDLVGEFVSIASRDDKLGESQKEMKAALLAESTREIRKLLGLRRCGVALI